MYRVMSQHSLGELEGERRAGVGARVAHDGAERVQ